MAGLIKFAKPMKSEVYILHIARQPFSRALETAITRNQDHLKELYGERVHLHFDTIWSKEVVSSVHSYIQRTHSDALVLYIMRKEFLKDLFRKDALKILNAIIKYPIIVFNDNLTSPPVSVFSMNKSEIGHN
jgi:hypothetical protein